MTINWCRSATISRCRFSSRGQMHCAAAAMIAILWFSAAFAAQESPTGNATVLAFDVVSIKSLAGMARARMPGARQSQGRFARAAATLRQLVQYAYDVQPLQVTGGPAWASTSRFQVDARTERTTTPAQMRAMVRQMLAERFALKVHPTCGNVRSTEWWWRAGTGSSDARSIASTMQSAGAVTHSRATLRCGREG